MLKTLDSAINFQREIGLKIVDAFDSLASDIIAIRNRDIPLPKYSNTQVVRTMEDIGRACPSLTGDFNCGTSASHAQVLFGMKSGMSYHRYFARIVKAYYELYNLDDEYRTYEQRMGILWLEQLIGRDIYYPLLLIW